MKRGTPNGRKILAAFKMQDDISAAFSCRYLPVGSCQKAANYSFFRVTLKIVRLMLLLSHQRNRSFALSGLYYRRGTHQGDIDAIRRSKSLLTKTPSARSGGRRRRKCFVLDIGDTKLIIYEPGQRSYQTRKLSLFHRRR
jgi:hypothetical protein